MIDEEYEIGSKEHALALATQFDNSEELTISISDLEICAKALRAYAPTIATEQG